MLGSFRSVNVSLRNQRPPATVIGSLVNPKILILAACAPRTMESLGLLGVWRILHKILRRGKAQARSQSAREFCLTIVLSISLA